MIIVKKIKPMFNQVLTTAEKYKADESSLIITEKEHKETIKEYQKVLAVGDSVRGIKVGDLVAINPKRYEVKKYQEGSLKDGVISHNAVIGYNFPLVEIDGEDFLYIMDNDVSYVVEEYEEFVPTTIVKDKDVRGNIIV